eukprot:TRINITY_DN8091_c0_g1_i1.p3 TRINITY_DN8091_c0_g1~~TRINITY_DN8091_c0_g1_i1.p3  ORF type:complete len:118 (+),score=3.55 TRINITY_DN8091_c0_g1_i1:503-856(+)
MRPLRLPRPRRRRSSQAHRLRPSKSSTLPLGRRARQQPRLLHRIQWVSQGGHGWRRQAPTPQVVEDLRGGIKAPTWRAGGEGSVVDGVMLGAERAWLGGVSSANGRVRDASPVLLFL